MKQKQQQLHIAVVKTSRIFHSKCGINKDFVKYLTKTAEMKYEVNKINYNNETTLKRLFKCQIEGK